ncbi:MAG: hypothetical protein F6K58_05550 [Symploca sp. SIO2E9]|nr:hypothetical protein [Symploca sp. SIO2E9]
MNIRYNQFLCFLGFSAITMLGSGLIADSARGGELIIKHPASANSGGSQQPQPTSPCSELKKKSPNNNSQDSSTDENKKSLEFQGKRIELFYYRNAENVVKLINQLPLEKGCATLLPSDALNSGSGVGRGGGNIVFLYGTEEYIEDAHRVIAPLDLPLPGIDLQLWGVQISSKNPDQLAEVMTEVREEINQTQQLVRETFSLFQQEAQLTLRRDKLSQEQLQSITQQRLNEGIGELPSLNEEFKDIAKYLGYIGVIENYRSFSILDVFLVGKAVNEPSQYHQNLYSSVVKLEEKTNGSFKALDKRYQPYFDAMKEKDRPPFERVFRARGLKPDCTKTYINPIDPDDNYCEKWEWKEIYSDSVKRIENASGKTTLEFAFQYADFTSNPNLYNPAELQRTSQILNSEVQQFINLFQKDIEDLFVRPTLRKIQDIVSKKKGVSFAQVGRTTIATLSGVETEINSSSSSAFEIPQSPSFEELLTRAQSIEKQLSPFVPTETIPGAQEATEITAGSLPISRLIGLFVALTAQQSKPVEIKTGTNLTFTPGVLRDFNSAELNINLTVIDPTFSPTQGEGAVNISRVGKQEVKTTVYTQAF